MRLLAHAINTDAGGRKVLDERVGVGGLLARPLEVVVVVEELGGQAEGLDDGLSFGEGNGDVGRADVLVPDVGGAPRGGGGARVGECFIYDVPLLMRLLERV